MSDSDESDDFIPDQNFHHGTTWPLDASLEVSQKKYIKLNLPGNHNVLVFRILAIH